ncbi:MAG: alternative oxidase [Candidatus Binatia bacterium]
MERLTSEQLKREQQKTLTSARMRYGPLASLLFISMDLLYGRRKTPSKFKVLEVIARMPYQAWENVAYVAMTHTHAYPDFARRIFDRVKESRLQQDNEQWHLLILEELTAKKGTHENFFWYRILPQMIAFFYYHISWLLYVIRPEWSYLMNAHFEDHAEHEYMEFVSENPALEAEPFESMFKDDYGQFPSLADLFRHIGYDERVHKLESLARVESARFE